MKAYVWKKFMSVFLIVVMLLSMSPIAGAELNSSTNNERDVTEAENDVTGLGDTTYETTFSDYELGEKPDDWSILWQGSDWTVDEEPSRLKHMVSQEGRSALVWDEVGEVEGDVEVAAIVKASNTGDTMLQLFIHASGEEGNETGFYVDVRNPNASSTANRIRLGRYRDGSFQLNTSAELPFTMQEDTWYRIVFQREGTMNRAKIWPDGEDEPAEWNISFNNTLFNSGQVGVGAFTQGTVNEWAYFSVGVNGEAAPRAPEDLLDDYRAPGDDDDEPPIDYDPLKTEFENSGGVEWTSHQGELDFLETIAEESERMTYTEVGTSVEGRPIHLVRVGYPAPPPDEEIAAGRNMLVIGTQHGNEPAPREMALELLRDLAFTDDPEMIELLSKSTILFIPTANPDAREANIRRNAQGVDTNRDHLHLETPESQAIATVLNQFTPDITIDGHERPSGQNPDMEVLWPRNLNVDEELRTLNVEMVQQYVRPDVEAAGFTTGLYGAGGGGETIARNMIGLRHGLALLTETGGRSAPDFRVEAQKRTVESVLRFYNERFDDVVAVNEGSVARKAQAGADLSEPFYLGGADNSPPSDSEILNPHACGYLLHVDQAALISRHIDLFSIVTETVGENGVFLSMAQPMMTVIPYLVDERATNNIVSGLPVSDCSDLGDLEPPEPPELTDPANYETDFYRYAVGEQPHDWSTQWRDSNWTVLDEPRLLNHYVDSAGGRRALTWDEVGDVHGNVEVSALVRPDQVTATMFQLGLHISGDAGNENAYYADIRHPSVSSANRIRINKYENGNYTLLASAVLPFPVEEDTWYHVVLQRDGNNLRAKAWLYGEEEPEDWQVVTLDSSLDHGKVGVAQFTNGSVNDFAHIGVGTGGDAAPRAPDNILEDNYIHTALTNLVNEIHEAELDSNAYTEQSWDAFAGALAEAEAILDDEEATYEELHIAFNTLFATYKGLELKPIIDKEELQNRVDEILAENLDPTVYTLESWQAFQAALTAAIEALENENATQVEVDAALASLNEAYNGLEEKPPLNKEPLQVLVDNIVSQNLDEADYTEESWQALQSALADAIQVLEDDDVLQAEVDDALITLINAYFGLEESHPGDRGKGKGKGKGQGNGNDNGNGRGNDNERGNNRVPHFIP